MRCSHTSVTSLVIRLERDGVGPTQRDGGRPEVDPADGDAVPVSLVGVVHRTRRSVSCRHVLG